MDVRLQQITECIINHSVALYAVGVRKCGGNYHDVEVPFAVPRTLVTCVQMTLVLDLQFIGTKRVDKAPANEFLAVGAHGSTRLNGLTVTDS